MFYVLRSSLSAFRSLRLMLGIAAAVPVLTSTGVIDVADLKQAIQRVTSRLVSNSAGSGGQVNTLPETVSLERWIDPTPDGPPRPAPEAVVAPKLESRTASLRPPGHLSAADKN